MICSSNMSQHILGHNVPNKDRGCLEKVWLPCSQGNSSTAPSVGTMGRIALMKIVKDKKFLGGKHPHEL